MSDELQEPEIQEPMEGETPEAGTGESEKLTELRRRLALYRDMETNILTGGAQSYGVGNRTLSRYGVSLSEVRATIRELEQEIAAELEGFSRWSGNMFPIDD